MRVAWFLPRGPAAPHLIDDTASLVAELGDRYQIELYDERRAHDFVWQHWRQPFDVCVYELSDTNEAAFVWPYLLHYPGALRLRSNRLGRSRRDALHVHRRADDYASEVAFGGRAALRIPLTRSKLTVVADARAAQILQENYPAARVRHAPLGIPIALHDRREIGETPTVGVVGTTPPVSVDRSAARARDAGAVLDLRLNASPADAPDCDIVVALEWPPRPEPPLGALLAMARGRVAIVFETSVTAAWPAIDPQTWQPRGFQPQVDPVVVSIDPRDAEQSLMQALRRLSLDPELRRRIGTSAQTWARTHATSERAVEAWGRLLAEAAALDPPSLPPDWPRHLNADGTQRARAMLEELGVSVDFLPDLTPKSG